MATKNRTTETTGQETGTTETTGTTGTMPQLNGSSLSSGCVPSVLSVPVVPSLQPNPLTLNPKTI